MNEIEVWKKWKKDKKNHNKDLLDVVSGRVEYAVKKFSNSGIPQSVLRTEAKKLALKQADNYDPKFGSSLNTHVSIGLKKLNDFVEDEKNTVRVPNYLNRQIPNFLMAKDYLSDKLGREPTSSELADNLAVGIKNIRILQKEVSRAEIGETSSKLEGLKSFERNDEEDLINMHYYDIKDPKEKLIYEYSFGLFGRKRLKPKEISKKVNMPEHQVRKVQHDLASRIDRYL